MGRKPITAERLTQGGKAAAAAAEAEMALQLRLPASELDGVLACRYVGTVEDGAPLHCSTRVAFEWEVPELALKHKSVLHSSRGVSEKYKMPLPKELQTPLLVASLPVALEKHRHGVPGMKRYAFVKVHGIALQDLHVVGPQLKAVFCGQAQRDEVGVGAGKLAVFGLQRHRQRAYRGWKHRGPWVLHLDQALGDAFALLAGIANGAGIAIATRPIHMGMTAPTAG